MESGFTEGYAVGRDASNNNNNGAWGADGGFFWWIIVFALIFGWGNGGWGGGFGGNGGAGMQGALTRGDLCQDMNFNNLENAVRGISQGICDSTYALNNTITSGNAALQSTLCQGFYGVQSGLQAQGYESRLATQGLSAQLANCCCDLQASIKDVACQSASNTAAIIQSGNMNTQRILDYLCNQDIERKNEKIAALQLENQNLKFASSQANQNAFFAANQEAQTAELIRRLGRDNPVPAYIVPNPNCCYGNYPYGYANSGCGCNTGCGCANAL